MKYLFSVLLILFFCFGHSSLIWANTDLRQKMGSSSEIWIDSPAPISANNNLEPAISSQPFIILVLITIFLTLVVAIMLFSIFNSSSKKKPTSQNNLTKDGKSNFEIIDSCALDNGQNLYIVQFLDRKFLLGTTLTSINLISEITSEIPALETKRSTISNLDFMTVRSEFNLNNNENAKANGFAALLNNRQESLQIEEEPPNNKTILKEIEKLKNVYSNLEEEAQSNEAILQEMEKLKISDNEIQTNRNPSKFQSFFNKKQNSEIPQLIQVSPSKAEEEPEVQKKEEASKFANTSKSKLSEMPVSKKPSWLQDKKVGENKFPINLKERMSADKNLKNKNTQIPTNKIPPINQPAQPLSAADKLASQLASNINAQKNSIEALAESPIQASPKPETNRLAEVQNQMPFAVSNSGKITTSLRKISIVED